jgi:trehalose synthase
MALGKVTPRQVEVGSAPIDRFRGLLGDDAWTRLDRAMHDLAENLGGRTVWNINSTARGGGVAELLASLIPYSRGAGIDERWMVIEGGPEFFKVSKKIHTLLHGVAPDGSHITGTDASEYEQTMAGNAAALVDLIRAGDVALLHDPQTAGLVPALHAQGAHVIWRSHIGVDQPNAVVQDAWRFLTRYVEDASAFVFSRRAYVWEGLDASRVHIIAPCIDPFTTKNAEVDGQGVAAILRACGLVSGSPDGEATFIRQDGDRGRVTRSADAGGAMLPFDARIVLQVSRWDRLKDPAGVMDAFVQHIAPNADAWLVLAGPAATSVSDDPEQPEILRALHAQRQRFDAAVRDRIVIAQLPMEDGEENAAIVNALQRHADVVVQKSLAEGFGLTVAEAMWKSRPLVASRVGGIGDQIEDGTSGVLIDDPHDLRTFGEAVVSLLTNEPRAKALGREARLRILDRYIAPRHLMEQAELISSLLR